MEIWKNIQGFEGFYQISNYGNIKSLRRIKSNRWGFNKNASPEIILKLPFSNGYKAAALCKNGTRKTHLVHILVGKHFIHNEFNKPFINHLDGNRANNHYTNLQWSTNAENQLHSYNVLGNKAVNGRFNGASKLTEYQVIIIRALAKTSHLSYKAMGALFGVTQSCIGAVVNNYHWKHLKD